MGTMMVELAVEPLSMHLDMACPIAWPATSSQPRARAPARQVQAAAVPDSSRAEDTSSFVRQRYLQTLYLPDTLAPLGIFALDLLRLHRREDHDHHISALLDTASSDPEGNRPEGTENPLGCCLMTLPAIERKHRKILPTLVNALLRASLAPQTSAGAQELTANSGAETMAEEEVNALQLGLEFRLAGQKGVLANALNGSAEELRRAVKKVTEELERREVMLQILLLLAYLTHRPKKAKKRTSKKSSPVEMTATDDPRKTLDMLTDRMNVWQAVAGLTDDGDTNAAQGEEGWIPQFCRDVVEKHFTATQPKLCASFHAKIFGSSPPPAPIADRAPSPSPSVQSFSRAPSAQPSHARRDSLESRGNDFQRAGSVASLRDDSRSRSRSRDPSAAPSFAPRPTALDGLGGSAGSNVNVLQSRRSGVRVASGKNLFKNREVGLSRTSSFSTTMAAGAMAKHADNKGLMAVVGKRKTLYVPQGARRVSGESLPATTSSMGPPKAVARQVSAPQVCAASATALAMATPSKPRPFARAHTLAQVTRVIPPTPIQDEPPAFVAETPSANAGKRRRQSGDASSMKRPGLGTLWPGPGHKRAPSSGDEGLGQLMVDTDDEGDEPLNAQSLPAYMVMETPRKT